MNTTPTVAPREIGRRAVLAAGAGAAGLVALGVTVGVRLAARPLPLDGTLLAGMVGQTFVDTGSGARLRLESVDGLSGARVTAESFSLLFVADGDVPAATRTLRHRDGDLVVYLGPVTADSRIVEAVVNRTGGVA